MSTKQPKKGSLLIRLIIIVLILSWITYGTLEGALGGMSYLLAGLLGIFPWFLPFVGIPLGLLDLFGLFGEGLYTVSLHLAHVDSSWLTVLWYTVVAVSASIWGFSISRWILRRLRKPPIQRNLALVNCRIIDGKRDSQMIENGVILVRNIVGEGEMPGRITAVGRMADIQIPTDYERVDLAGQVVMPGLINAHCHLLTSGAPTFLMKLFSENEQLVVKIMGLLDSSFGKRLMLRMMKTNVRNALHSGVTTLRVLGEAAYLDVKLRKMIERGEVEGPRLLVAGLAVVPSGGHGGYVGDTADSPSEVRRLVRLNVRNEVNWIKIISTGGVMDARRLGEAGQPQMTVEEIEAACDTAHRAGVMVATHCESTKGIEEALLGGVDTIEHGAAITDELAPLFKNNPKALRGYTVLTPTIAAPMGLVTLPTRVTKISEMSMENGKIVARGMALGLRRAYAEGIPLAVGTDAGVPYVPHYEFWKELKYYLHYTNMTAQEAIYFATCGNAQVLGIAEETGSIEVGKSADLLVVEGNPLEDIDCLGRAAKVVMRGVLIDKPRVKRVKALEKTPITNYFEVE